MKDLVDENYIANQIRMRRNSFQGTFMIVEGRSDKLIYESLVDTQYCDFTIAFGKENAIKAIGILEQDNFQGALTVVDADFDNLEDKEILSLNVMLTDEHDLEMMLIKSPALEKLMRELGSEEKIKKINQDIRQILLLSAKDLGYLRWLSLQKNLCLKFEELSFEKFIDKNTLDIDLQKLIKTIKNHSQKMSLVESDILGNLEVLKDDNHDLWQVCCGHDLICILSIGLSKIWGSKNTNEVKPDLLERELRLAYEYTYFIKTQLYLSLRTWEKNNNPYKIFKADDNITASSKPA